MTFPYILPFDFPSDTTMFDWDEWARSQWLGPNTPGLAEVLKKHRFVRPDDRMDQHHCANGWSGDSWPEHIAECINTFITTNEDNLP